MPGRKRHKKSTGQPGSPASPEAANPEKKQKRSDGSAADAQPAIRIPETYDTFYRANLVSTGLLTDEGYAEMIEAFRTPLPTTLWITPNSCHTEKVKEYLCGYMRKTASTEVTVKPIPWYPKSLGWYVNIPRNLLRKDPAFSPLHKFMIEYTDRGIINRQEEASMIPVAMLGVEAGDRCLDMCAAPGSKTGQILVALAEANTQRWGRGKVNPSVDYGFQGRVDYSESNGLVVANDVNTERINLLVHQIKRLSPMYPLMLFTNHDARFFPSLSVGGNGDEILFDRILCDVMCSGDGIFRKAPFSWRTWHPANSVKLHADQIAIALRACRLLRTGGRMVYSTCSLSPVENEAVVAAILRSTDGGMRLVDGHALVPGLKTLPGLATWQVMCPKTFALYSSFEEVKDGSGGLTASMFPPNPDSAEAAELRKCCRVLPHIADTGGFFVAVFEKTKPIRRRHDMDTPPDAVLSYDSEVDSDGEDKARRETITAMRSAIKNATNDIDVAKAKAKLKRASSGGTLQREVARYRPFVEAMSGVARELLEAYGMEGLPADQLMCRFHLELDQEGNEVQLFNESNQILYCSKDVAEAITYGVHEKAKRKWKICSGGLRAFQHDRFESKRQGSEKPGGERTGRVGLSYRIAHESVELLLPYVNKRLVTVERYEDTVTILKT
eukprot:Sspe_Gene.89237::Locus_61050_Transcript_1_1_Confidence_1.000_Length_2082::g.89237::m.89237/K15335/NSUN2; tRNA (cytosine34-C5)-methyltransferase